jgi:hypothetical protein
MLQPRQQPSGPVSGGLTANDFLVGGAGAASGLTIGIGGSVVTLETVTKEIDRLAANDPKAYGQIEDLVEAAGFTSVDSALKAAALDDNKDSQSWGDYLVGRSKNPYIKKMVNDGRGGGGSGGAYSSRNTTTRLSSETEAGTVADQNFNANLGRTASNEEAKQFQQALNEREKKSPSVTNTSGYSDGKGGGYSNSVSSGGFDPTRFAREYAMSQEGYAERFAGMTFMNILDDAIADPNAIDDLIASGNG